MVKKEKSDFLVEYRVVDGVIYDDDYYDDGYIYMPYKLVKIKDIEPNRSYFGVYSDGEFTKYPIFMYEYYREYDDINEPVIYHISIHEDWVDIITKILDEKGIKYKFDTYTDEYFEMECDEDDE